MKRFIAVLLCFTAIACTFFGCGNSSERKFVNIDKSENNKFVLDESWALTFSDDFDGTDFDRTKWHYGYSQEEIRRGGYWVDDAVFVKDGCLTIRTDYRENGKFGSGWYTGTIETAKQTYGASANTEGFEGFSQNKGYFEIRCKVPEAFGMWAAFWLMPDNNFKGDTFGTGTDGAEIDIFESPFMCMDEGDRDVISHAIHIDGYGEELKSLGSDYIRVEDLYKDFHTYALEWNEDSYIFYVDGYKTWETQDALGTVSDIASYIILSVEVGGTNHDGKVFPGLNYNGEGEEMTPYWAGTPEDNDKSVPYDFVIDYVKVYQKNA